MRKRIISLITAITMVLTMFSSASMFAVQTLAADGEIAADDAIKGVKTIGFVDLEGAKVKGIVLEYDREIDAASVSAEDFEVSDYTTIKGQIELDYDSIEGNEGQIEKVYVNDAAELAEEGKESGKYVIIEVNTAYMLSGQNLSYTESMAGGATQIGEITGADGTVITAATEEASNYTITESVGRNGRVQQNIDAAKETILLPEFGEGTGWTLHYISTDEDYHLSNNGEAFKATDCYSEYTGEGGINFEMPYSIYVPSQEVLDANKGKVAIVIHMEHAGANDTDPMAGITSSKSATKLAAIGSNPDTPAIVVVPQIENSRRSTNDYDASSEANTAIWQLMDYLVRDKYADYIDTNRIYGTGQSMGGMTILNMASQRDNYFGGIAVIGGQWSNNYAKLFQNGGLRTPEKDPVAFDVANGGFGHDIAWYEENFENWYYMISDDNIFIHTCIGDPMAHGEWKDAADYFAAAGVTIPYTEYDPYLPLEEQNAKDKELTDHDNSTPGSGINWSGFTKGNHMSTWKYAYALDYPFEWLFKQSKETADARGKVEQLNNDWIGRDAEGNLLEGCGTKGLNSAQFTPQGASAIYTEGWTPESVTVATIAELPDHKDVTEENSKAIEDARALYDKLSEDQKLEIGNYRKLVLDEEALKGASQAEPEFSDVTAETVSNGAMNAVKWAAGEGIIKGFADGTFKPENSCTREQFVIMFWRFAGKPEVTADVSFSDVDSSMSSYKAIQWAVKKGIIKGFDDGSFQPEGTVTRRQVAVMLWRMAGKPEAEKDAGFSDVEASESTYKAIQWGAEAGLIKGYDDGTFKPEDDCQRQHIAIFLYRFDK